MADPSTKHTENLAGKYYVDDSCGACQVCVSLAPENIQMTEDEDHAFISKQPENDEEIAAVADAIDSCPDEAIGDDGEG